MEELYNEPTVEEPIALLYPQWKSKAIDSLASGKAPGNDAIPPAVIKHGKPTLLLHLHELLYLCWKEGAVPQDMRDAKIVTLTNVCVCNCNNYSGISLLSIEGKVDYKS